MRPGQSQTGSDRNDAGCLALKSERNMWPKNSTWLIPDHDTNGGVN